VARLAKHILNSMTFGRTDAREASVAQHVPYMRHVEEDMLKTKEGHFMMVVKVGGFCFQTADQVEIDMRLSSRNTIIRSMNDSRFAVWSHIVRREVTPEIGGDFDNFFCAELNRRYMETQVHKRMFVNDLYFTIIRRGFQGKVGMATKPRISFVREWESIRLNCNWRPSGSCATRSAITARKWRAMARACSAACCARVSFAPKSASFWRCCSTADAAVDGAPRMGLDEYLRTKRITFGKKALEFRGATQNETRFGGMLSIREYPAYTGAGMLDGLLRVPHEMIVSQSFALEDRAPVMSHVAKVERQIAASDEKGTAVETAINIARNELVTGQTVLGYHHLTVCALGRRLRDLEKCVQEVTQSCKISGRSSCART